jgi:hypothetical protein
MAIPGVAPRAGGPLYGATDGASAAWVPPANDDIEVLIDPEVGLVAGPRTDPTSGAVEIPQEDGSILIDLTPDVKQGESEDHQENLALRLNESQLMSIGSELLTAIQEDDRSRQEWLEMRAKGLDLLGLKLETARAGAGTAAPLEGMSTVRHPLLQEAVLRFQANSYSELCPARGPAKVVNYSDQTTTNDQLANALERDLNTYLTTTATEYYPDTDRMLWWLGYGGTMFKKVYPCPLRRRPVSEMVDAKDLIVSDAVTDLANAPRVTHEITMRRSVLKRMQILGVYRNVSLTDTPVDLDPVDRKVGEIQGVSLASLNRPEDADYQLYECYCELDIEGFNHVDDEGNPTGLALPYRVTLDKTSGRVLEVRRNWKEDDEDYLPRIPFVQYTFVRGMGFYGIGLLHILGNTTRAITSAWRLMLDAGMFANFPGFLFAKPANRQVTNEFRVPPGGGSPIDIGAMQSIRDAIMPLPYKEPGPALMQLTENIAQTGQRVGGTAEAPVGEGVQNAPVGTTLALIEQATRIEGAVHKRLHQAQSEELQKLVELFREDPESLWRANKRCQLKKDTTRTLHALEDCDIIPFADPSVPSRMHRLAKVAAVKQLQAQSPQLYDPKQVDTMCLMEIGIADPESLFAAPGPPPQPDPIMMAQIALKDREVKIKELEAEADIRNKEKDRVLKENLATMQVAERIATHPGSLGMVETAVEVMPKLMQKADQAAGRDGSGTGRPGPGPQVAGRRPMGPPPTRPPAFGPIGMPGQPGMSVVPPPPRRQASAGGSMTRRPIRPIDLSRFI